MIASDFASFYSECKGRLTPLQLKQLDPFDAYFKMQDGWIGLRSRVKDGEKQVLLNIVVGSSPRWLWDLKRCFRALGIAKVFYECRLDGAGERFAKYFGGSIERSRFSYEDGHPGVWCSLSTDCRRLNHG